MFVSASGIVLSNMTASVIGLRLRQWPTNKGQETMHFDERPLNCALSPLRDAQCPLCCHYSPGADEAGSVDGNWLAPPALGGGGTPLAPPTGDGALSISRLLASPS